MKKRNGFTIVELVIVIALIGVLTGILLPMFASVVAKAELSADLSAVKELNTVLALEEIEDGSYDSVQDMMTILERKGYMISKETKSNGYAFFFMPEKNRVALGREKENGYEVVYPEEYSGVTLFTEQRLETADSGSGTDEPTIEPTPVEPDTPDEPTIEPTPVEPDTPDEPGEDVYIANGCTITFTCVEEGTQLGGVSLPSGYIVVSMEYASDADGTVTIPDTFRELPVVAIADALFASNQEQPINDVLETLTISKNVKYIGENSFAHCRKLTKVIFASGSTLEKIGKQAFINDLALESIALPDSVKGIGESAFTGCSALTAVFISENSELTKIEAQAFSGCSALKESKVGAGAFLIPEKVIQIGANAFLECGIEYLIMCKSNTSGAWHAYDTDGIEMTISEGYESALGNANRLKGKEGDGASYCYRWSSDVRRDIWIS